MYNLYNTMFVQLYHLVFLSSMTFILWFQTALRVPSHVKCVRVQSVWRCGRRTAFPSANLRRLRSLFQVCYFEYRVSNAYHFSIFKINQKQSLPLFIASISGGCTILQTSRIRQSQHNASSLICFSRIAKSQDVIRLFSVCWRPFLSNLR